MTIEQALDELRKCANELSQIGNVDLYRQTNNRDFLIKWTTLRTLYQNIVKHENDITDVLYEAADIVVNVGDLNPSIRRYIDSLSGNIRSKKETKNNSVESKNEVFDASALGGKIESYISQIRDMQFYDPDELGDIEWALEHFKGQLNESKSYFEPQVYQSLIDDIDSSLAEIAQYNNIINSDLMEGIKRM